MTYKTNLAAFVWLNIIAAAVMALFALIALQLGFIGVYGGVLLAWYPFCFAVATVIIDLAVPDQRAAYLFGSYETSMSPQARLTRNLILIVYPQILVILFILVQLYALEERIQSEPFFIMISASFATAGWLYSNYMQQLNTRAHSTLEFLKETMADPNHLAMTEAFRRFIRRASDNGAIDVGEYTFSHEDIEKLNKISEPVTVDGRNYQFNDVANYLLAHHEYMGLAVRTGNFSFEIIQRQKRRLILWHYNALIELIVTTSEANKVTRPRVYDYRQGSGRWENFIWLAMELGRRGVYSDDVEPRVKIDLRKLRRQHGHEKPADDLLLGETRVNNPLYDPQDGLKD